MGVRKIELKEKAISLRKSGKTYSEILKIVPVAKSTLSEWLRSVGIAKSQKQAFTEKKRLASLSGGRAKREQRIKKYNQIVGEAENEIGKMTKRELWLIGTALYWAEGDKEKESNHGIGIKFSNSDPRMIILFIKWLMEICKISIEDIVFEIYVHDLYRLETPRFKDFWSKSTGFSIELFNRVYFKKGNIKTNRKNVGNLYNGLLRVRVNRSSSLNRRITGWVKGINKYWGVV
ncbi:MAG: hypothetical protein WCC74_00260 [Minisyncoccia bacterium]